MKVIIAGSRTIYEMEELEKAMERCRWDITEVVSGCAYGVDALGEQWAADHRIKIKYMDADWFKYGKPAGMIRNKAMAKYADAAIILWDGVSPGTRNMIDEMRIARKPYIVHVVAVEECMKQNLKKLEAFLPI